MFFWNALTNWIIIFNHNKLAKLYNSLISIHTNFNGKINFDHVSRYRRYVYALLFLISIEQCITSLLLEGLTTAYLLAWLKVIIETLTFHLLVEYIFMYIALAYRRIVSSDGVIFVEENVSEFEEQLNTTEEISTLSNNDDAYFMTVMKRNDNHNSGNRCFKRQHTSRNNSFRCETYIEATSLLLRLSDCVELAMNALGYAIVMKMLEATIDSMANVYFTIQELKTKTLFEHVFQIIFLFDYITKLIVYATLSEMISEEVRINRCNNNYSNLYS